MSDGLVSQLVPPPQARSGVCTRCRSWNDGDGDGDGDCSNCQQTADVLGRPGWPISVISLYRKPSLLREWLTGYKGRLDDDEDPLVPEYVPLVRSLLGRFFADYGAALDEATSGYDAIVVVPSSSRTPPHPLTEIVDSLQLSGPTVALLKRGAGEIGFRRPSLDGFVATGGESATQQRVLVIDDVYTTGARANSAAYALDAAGFAVAGVLVIARRVNPDYNERSAKFWAAQTGQPFTWERSPLISAGD